MIGSEYSIPEGLLREVRALGTSRRVEHCGAQFEVPVFEIYATCPSCGVRMKLRCLSGTSETEDVFDAVFEWLLQPGAFEAMARRVQQIADDCSDD